MLKALSIATVVGAATLAALSFVACTSNEVATADPTSTVQQSYAPTREAFPPPVRDAETASCEPNTCSCTFTCANGDTYTADAACNDKSTPTCGDCGYCAEQGGVTSRVCRFTASACGLCTYETFLCSTGRIPVLVSSTCRPGFRCGKGWVTPPGETCQSLGRDTSLCYPED